MSDFNKKLIMHESGLRFFSFTPPKDDISINKLYRLNSRRNNRLKEIEIDGVLIYDVQDENGYGYDSRPFEYKKHLNAFSYADSFCAINTTPQIRFAALDNYSKESLVSDVLQGNNDPLVLVGSSVNGKSKNSLSLSDAYSVYNSLGRNQPLGGIAIPERHNLKRNEARVMVTKQKSGVNFFISQCIFNPDLMIKLIQDYKNECESLGIKPVTIIMSFTPVLDVKGLQLLEWLGINVPQAFTKEFISSRQRESFVYSYLKCIIIRLAGIFDYYQVPFGINIESVINKRPEVDFACSLAREMFSTKISENARLIS